MPGNFCSYCNCRNNSSNSIGKTFHRFPKDELRCRLWLKNCGNLGLSFGDHLRAKYICSDHFEISSYISITQNSNRLRNDAVPAPFKDTCVENIKFYHFGESPTSPVLEINETDVCNDVPHLNFISNDSLCNNTMGRLSMSAEDTLTCCYISHCDSTNRKDPELLFIPFPKDEVLRGIWSKVFIMAHVNSAKSLNKKYYYVCEKHFDLRNDTVNYDEYLTRNAELQFYDGAIPRFHLSSKKLYVNPYRYRTCFVPGCFAMGFTSPPGKILLPIPDEPNVRMEWFAAVGRTGLETNSDYNCCLDHFDVKFDCYQGRYKKVSFRPNVIPHLKIKKTIDLSHLRLDELENEMTLDQLKGISKSHVVWVGNPSDDQDIKSNINGHPSHDQDIKSNINGHLSPDQDFKSNINGHPSHDQGDKSKIKQVLISEKERHTRELFILSMFSDIKEMTCTQFETFKANVYKIIDHVKE